MPAQPPLARQPQLPPLPAMQTYSDPEGHFTIEYPQGWHVRNDGETTFYQGEPRDEGPWLRVKTSQVFDHELTAEQVLARFTKDAAGDPSVRLSNQKVQMDGSGVETASVDALDTSRTTHAFGRVIVRVAHPAAGSTVAWTVAYVAPQDAFASLEPLFDHMFRTYRPK